MYIWTYSIVVSTKDFESFNLGSNPSRSLYQKMFNNFTASVAQLVVAFRCLVSHLVKRKGHRFKPYRKRK